MRGGSVQRESTGAFRSDIEGLRAIAVLLVVVYHAKLGPFHGGLVGVDVFFVLSGYLITSLLLREIDTSGRVSLPGFWARRARRLLPASTVTVLATVAAAHWMLSPLDLRSLGHDALAAAGFVINIVFMRRNNDYFAAQSAASPLLHFWSLAVEEQFYVVWPVLIALAATRRRPRRWIAPGVTAIVIASFAAGLWYTTHSPISAFYMLPMRAWELGAGALLAIAGTAFARIPAPVRAALGWAGLAGVIVAALIINDRTPFPGYAALLPVLSTAALVAAGTAPTTWSPARMLSLVPLQWVGKRSYAIYLWHWPAYILATSQWGPLNNWQSAATMGVAIVIAAVSYAVVENPIRHDAWLAARTRRPLVLAVSLVALTAAFAITVTHESIPTGTGTATAPTLAPLTTLGSASTTPTIVATGPTATDAASTPQQGGPISTSATQATTSTAPPPPNIESLIAANQPNIKASLNLSRLPRNLTPSPSSAKKFLAKVFHDSCAIRQSGDSDVGKGTCVYGDPNSTVNVVVVGDSHAGQWFPPLEALAVKYGWRLVVLIKTGCPPEDVTHFKVAPFRRDCVTWRQNVLKRLDEERPDLLLIAHYRYDLNFEDFAARYGDEWERGLDEYFTKVRGLATRVAFLSDVPGTHASIPSCLLQFRASIQRCSIPRATGAALEIHQAEARLAARHGVTYINTDDWFCGERRCAVILGRLLVYADNSHITNEAALFFQPFLEATLGPLVPAR